MWRMLVVVACGAALGGCAKSNVDRCIDAQLEAFDEQHPNPEKERADDLAKGLWDIVPPTRTGFIAQATTKCIAVSRGSN